MNIFRCYNRFYYCHQRIFYMPLALIRTENGAFHTLPVKRFVMCKKLCNFAFGIIKNGKVSDYTYIIRAGAHSAGGYRLHLI